MCRNGAVNFGETAVPGIHITDQQARRYMQLRKSHDRPTAAAMAGFGTVLAAPIHDAFAGRILNTHPALLPSFPGWHGVADALDAGAEVTGCTVHLATLEMDAGPILAQGEVPVMPDDTVDSLHERIKAVERVLYPETIKAALDALDHGRTLDDIATTTKETTP